MHAKSPCVDGYHFSNEVALDLVSAKRVQWLGYAVQSWLEWDDRMYPDNCDRPYSSGSYAKTSFPIVARVAQCVLMTGCFFEMTCVPLLLHPKSQRLLLLQPTSTSVLWQMLHLLPLMIGFKCSHIASGQFSHQYFCPGGFMVSTYHSIWES